jgi:hypothetical protein
MPDQPSRRTEAGGDRAAGRQARAHAVHHTLLGWFQIPPAIDQPLELALNPAGDVWRSQRRVWNAGDGRTKLVCLAAPRDAGRPPCPRDHAGPEHALLGLLACAARRLLASEGLRLRHRARLPAARDTCVRPAPVLWCMLNNAARGHVCTAALCVLCVSPDCQVAHVAVVLVVMCHSGRPTPCACYLMNL